MRRDERHAATCARCGELYPSESCRPPGTRRDGLRSLWRRAAADFVECGRGLDCVPVAVALGQSGRSLTPTSHIDLGPGCAPRPLCSGLVTVCPFSAYPSEA